MVVTHKEWGCFAAAREAPLVKGGVVARVLGTSLERGFERGRTVVLGLAHLLPVVGVGHDGIGGGQVIALRSYGNDAAH